jgi:hypothetical protein
VLNDLAYIAQLVESKGPKFAQLAVLLSDMKADMSRMPAFMRGALEGMMLQWSLLFALACELGGFDFKEVDEASDQIINLISMEINDEQSKQTGNPESHS